MNKSYRIRTSPGGADKHLKIKIDQDVDNLEILSLNIGQKDLYNNFNANYGVVVGRVLGNNRVGIPNAKVSIFIPLTEEDEIRPEIVAIYPYKNPTDVDVNGTRYNLLPRVSRRNPNELSQTGIVPFTPVVPVGTFPIKEEVLANSNYLEVYGKYYKHTTTTNESGDYILYGVPIGIQTVHMSVDITDIGRFSMTPSTMQDVLGYPPSLFENNGTSIKKSSDLDLLPNVETQDVGIDIKPFWGNANNFEIGITRQDFKIRADLLNTFVVFGAGWTQGPDTWWGDYMKTATNSLIQYEKLRGHNNPSNDDGNNLMVDQARFSRYRGGTMSTEILYYPPNFSDEEIDEYIDDGTDDYANILQLENFSTFTENGSIAMVIPCNRKKIITDEFGNDLEVPFDNPDGIFTEFKGYMVFDFENLDINPPINGSVSTYSDGKIPAYGRTRMKVPQNEYSLTQPGESGEILTTTQWVKDYRTFKGGQYYSFGQWIGATTQYSTLETRVGAILVPESNSLEIITTLPGGDETHIYGNLRSWITTNIFNDEWINFCLYFQQFSYGIDQESLDQVNRILFNGQDHIINDNNQAYGGGLTNTKFISGNNFYVKTDFMNVPKEDLIYMRDNLNPLIGFRKDQIQGSIGQYLFDGNATPTPSRGPHFLKGLVQESSDCIKYLQELNLI